MISSLQSWRFIFALMIFLHHFPANGKACFEAGGSCGVSFFLILSGFVMAAGYGEKILSPSFSLSTYVKRRWARIYPLHLLCLLAAVLLSIKSMTWQHLLMLVPNALLLQSWIPVKDVYFSGNAVSWCLSDLFFFYALFPLLGRFLFRKKLGRSVLFVILFVILYFVFFLFIPEEKVHAFLYIFPVFRLLDFIIGMLLYAVYVHLKGVGISERLCNCSFGTKSVAEIFSVLLLSSCICAYPFIPDRFVYASYYWLPMGILILLFSLINISGGIISHILSKKWMVYLGNISFSIYMIHQLGINVLNAILNKLGWELSWQFRLPLCLVIILIVGVLVNRYYEKPLAAFFNGKM